eukprot:COSAG03_NODE_16328_length_405_cov_0.679739_1_plen_51_part_10
MAASGDGIPGNLLVPVALPVLVPPSATLGRIFPLEATLGKFVTDRQRGIGW